MGFWSSIFKKKKRQETLEDDWNRLVYDRDNVDFENEEQRSRYVTGCLEQMAEAGKEIERFQGEYTLVTSYLTDIEEIERLPKEARAELDSIADRIVALEKERERYQKRKGRMRDGDYYKIKEQEDQVQEGIRKLRDCENYGSLIRQDLQRLSGERHAFEYRREELEALMGDLRGMALIFLTAFVVCMILLLVLQFGFEMNTRTGYFLAVGAAALAEAILVVKYTDSDRELHRVESGINKLIQLQNKVKIRFVNNQSLREYLCMKYNTDSAEALEMLWKQYVQEKEERRQYVEADAKCEYYQELLVRKMRNYRIADPERWMGHSGALLDKREMVEIRHALIQRRQALRKQIDYNNEIAEKARKEIMDIVNQYPVYTAEILEMVNRFDSSVDG